jgi:hypothetical protein
MFMDNMLGGRTESELGSSLINLSANFDHYWMYPGIVEKKTDICFFGTTSSPDRMRFIEHIIGHSEWGQMENDIVLWGHGTYEAEFILKAEYFQRMAQSKVCINLGGAAHGRAFRFYEIPWSGSFMLSQEFPATQLHPFVDSVHCGYFSNEDELDGWLDWALTCGNSDTIREKIAAAGRQHLLEHHTCSARVKYLLDKIGHSYGS